MRARRLAFCTAIAALFLSMLGTPGASARAPLPAGPRPSEIAKMVCAAEAQHDMSVVLGEKAVVSRPTWQNHRYSCLYRYHSGSFGLSVKELSSWSQTKAYFARFGQAQGTRRPLGNLGQGAYQTPNGSVAVRKDWKVLYVDVSTLPASFGVPPTSRAAVAVTIADVILGCWDGD